MGKGFEDTSPEETHKRVRFQHAHEDAQRHQPSVTRTHSETPPHARQGAYGGGGSNRSRRGRETPGGARLAGAGAGRPRRETTRQLRKGQTQNRRRARQARRRDVLTAAGTRRRRGPAGEWPNQRGLHGGRDDPAAAREGVLTDRGPGRAPGAPSGGASQGRARPVTPRQARLRKQVRGRQGRRQYYAVGTELG